MRTGAERTGAGGPRAMVAWTLVALALQFVLGMFVNLFVQISTSHPGANGNYFSGVPQVVAWAVGNGALALRLHVVLGIVIFITGIAILVLAIRTHRRAWVWCAAVGIFGLFTAAGNGASFLIYNFDFSSFLMSLGFAIAMVAYCMGIYVTR